MIPFMSKTELDISQLGKADLIRYYELPDKSRGLLLICGGRYLNLCEHDAYWNMLVQAADRLYLNDSSVCMDTYTRDILESRKDPESVGKFGFLTKAARQSERYVTCGTNMFSERAVVYFLGQIYNDLETGFEFTGVRGWRGRYFISCKTDGKERQIPCRFTAGTDGYRYSFANLFEGAHTAEITLRYGCAKMEIVAESSAARELRREYSYDFSRNTLTQRAMSGREILFHDERPHGLPAAEMPESVGLVCGACCSDFTGYELPWGEKAYLCGDDSSRCRGSVFDNGSGLIVQICEEKLYGNTSCSICAVHEVFSRDDRMLVQSRLYGGRGNVLDSGREGYYYRYISGGAVRTIDEDLFGIPSAEILDRYLYS